MINLLTVSVVVFSFILFLFGCGKSQKIRYDTNLSYTITKTGEPPVVDGVLNESCWKNAPVGAFRLNKNGAEPEKMTAVRLAYDSTYLFIGFECRDPDAASTVTGRDSPVTDGECVSAYIDANSDSCTYVVFDVAPTGAVSDAFVLCRDDGAETKILGCWNCERLRASVAVYGGGAQPGTEDRFWTVEMAVPFNEFFTASHLPPRSGDVWRANFYRMELTGTREFSALAPTGVDTFHKPSRFTWLVFRE